MNFVDNFDRLTQDYSLGKKSQNGTHASSFPVIREHSY